MTTTLEQLRAELDQLDADLLSLLESRMALVAQVAATKAPGSPIFRPGREAQLIQRLISLYQEGRDGKAVNDDMPQLIRQIWQLLMRVSVHNQKPDFTLFFSPEARREAEIFAAGFITVKEQADASALLQQLSAGAGDLGLITEAELKVLATALGASSGLYVVSALAGCYIIGRGMPDESGQDYSLFALSDDATVAIRQRKGYFDAAATNSDDGWLIGIIQHVPDAAVLRIDKG